MRYLLSFLFMALLAAPVLAAPPAAVEKLGEPQIRGGFEGPVSGSMAETVEKARSLPDGARVILTGSVISRVAGEKDEYVFKDATGEIPVKISAKKFRDMKITPQSKVRVSGKLDRSKKNAGDAKIEVKMLELAK